MTGLAMPVARGLPFMRRALLGDVRAAEVDVPRMRRDPEAAAVLFAAHAAYMNRISGMKTLLRDTPEPARGPLSRARAAFGAVRKKASHRGHGGAPRRATNPNFLNGAPHRTCLTSAPGAQ
jgi:hypothetical protein